MRRRGAAVFLAVRWYGRENAIAFQDICAVLLGGVAIPLAMSCLLRLRLLTYGGGLVLMPLVAAFMSDSAALFTGMACGKHKLAPKASPKKTVEGAVGGLAGGVLGMIVFRIVFFLSRWSRCRSAGAWSSAWWGRLWASWVI